MKRRALLLLLIAVVGLSAACAEILGFRPPGPRPFEHRAHVLQGISCTRCHGGVSMAGEEGPQHLPTSGDCRSCHDHPHDEHSCAGCHGLATTRAGAARARQILRFEHSTHVPRVKGDCVRCHVDIERGADALRPRMATCGSCHEHTQQIVTDCDACHVDIHEEGVTPDDHMIHGPNFLREHGDARRRRTRQICSSCHQDSFCAGCHGVTTPALPEHLAFDEPMRAGVHRAGFLARHPDEARADPGLCTTCHAPSVCSSCHDRERISVVGGGASPHPSGWLGLPGQRNDHGRAAWRDPDTCAGCHGGAGEALCVGCHKVGGVGGNPHSASFKSRKQPKTDRPCRMCHGGLCDGAPERPQGRKGARATWALGDRRALTLASLAACGSSEVSSALLVGRGAGAERAAAPAAAPTAGSATAARRPTTTSGRAPSAALAATRRSSAATPRGERPRCASATTSSSPTRTGPRARAATSAW